MKKNGRNAAIVGLFALLLTAVAIVTSSPAWIKWKTLQTCDYTIIELDGDQLHFSMKRYVCPELKCFPQKWDHAFQHDHFEVTMEHVSAEGEKIDTVEREFVHMEGYGLSIGREYHPLLLVNTVLFDYCGNMQESKDGDEDVNRESVAPIEYPYWGTTRVYDQRAELCAPSEDPITNPLNNQGTGRGDTQF